MAWIISATFIAACSSTPRTTGSDAGGATPAQAAPQTLAAAGVAPAAAAPAAATSTAATAAAAPASDVDPSLVKAGYSVMKRHGAVLYCRNEIITGERIGTRVCLTAGQIQAEKEEVAKAKDLMTNHANRCMAADGCN